MLRGPSAAATNSSLETSPRRNSCRECDAVMTSQRIIAKCVNTRSHLILQALVWGSAPSAKKLDAGKRFLHSYGYRATRSRIAELTRMTQV